MTTLKEIALASCRNLPSDCVCRESLGSRCSDAAERTMALLGTANDGTPVMDILEHNRELSVQVTNLKRSLRDIDYICRQPDFKATRRHEISAIIEMTRCIGEFVNGIMARHR